MAYGCVPVLVDERWEPPFASLLVYESFALRVPPTKVPRLLETLRAVSAAALRRLQSALARVRRAFTYHLDGAPDGVLPLLAFSMAEALQRPMPAPTARPLATERYNDGQVVRSAATIEVGSLLVHGASTAVPTGRISDPSEAATGRRRLASSAGAVEVPFNASQDAVWQVREVCCGLCAAAPVRPYTCYTSSCRGSENCVRCAFGVVCDASAGQQCSERPVGERKARGIVTAVSWDPQRRVMRKICRGVKDVM